MRKNLYNILGIDWGTKYVGFAYVSQGSKTILPIGYIMNDGGFFFNLGDVITRYTIKKIVIGYPDKQEDVQKQIDKFIGQVQIIVGEDVEITKVSEDYTTVEAGALIGDFKKNCAEDTVSAIKILERRLETVVE